MGLSTGECWDGLVAGQSGIGPITYFDPDGCPSRVAGQIPAGYASLERDRLPPDFRKRSVATTAISYLVGDEAIRDAKLDLESADRERIAVISGCGGSTFGDQLHDGTSGPRLVPYSHDMLNAPAAVLSIEFGLGGPSYNVATACASGGYAVHAAASYVRNGGPAALAVGVERLLCREVVEAFGRLMALSDRNDPPQKASSPFDKNRSGFVLAEGACAILVEDLDAARRRGARIYALVAGGAMTSEAYNILAPDPEGGGMATTMSRALEDAGVSRETVGYVDAHGTSTTQNDAAETKAIKQVFGDHAYRLAVSSQKSMMGHAIGAAGALECAVTALTLYHQVLTPTINYEVPDPDCDLDYVPNRARTVSGLKAAISGSYGFGGHNTVVVMQRYTPGDSVA